jgi:hypothetical protein
MAEKIKLVQGDTKPQIKVTLTDETTGEPVDITAATPRLKFRAANTTTVLTTMVGTVTVGSAGECVFVWPTGALDVEPGDYEGEVEVTFQDNTIQSVYDLLKFKLRQDF